MEEHEVMLTLRLRFTACSDEDVRCRVLKIKSAVPRVLDYLERNFQIMGDADLSEPAQLGLVVLDFDTE